MRKLVTFGVILYLLCGSAPVFSASMVLTKDNGAVGNIVQNDSGSSAIFAYSDSDMRASHSRNPFTTRGFAEFNLQPWYDLGVDESNITSVVFEAPFGSVSAWPDGSYKAQIKFYKMNSFEDGAINLSSSEFNASVSQIGSTLYYGTYSSGLNIDVTSAFLEDAGIRNYSGYSIRLTDELIGNTSLYRSVSFESSPTLTILYDAPEPPAPTVPEPMTVSTLMIGMLGIIGRKLRNR